MVVVVLVLEREVKRVRAQQLLLSLGEVLLLSSIDSKQLYGKNRVSHAPAEAVHAEAGALQLCHDLVPVVFSVAVASQKCCPRNNYSIFHVRVHVARDEMFDVVPHGVAGYVRCFGCV